MLIIPGTCSACKGYQNNVCACANSRFFRQRLWSVACVDCGCYERSAVPTSTSK